MSGFAVREATAADLPSILAMLARDTIPADRETDPGDPRYAAAFDVITADPNQLLAVATLDDAVIGTAQLSFIPGLSFRGAWRGVIEAVRIDERHRGRRYGEQLIEWLVDRCRARDCFLVQLTSSNARVDAHRFYARLGWSQSHAGFKLKLKHAD
ncbi:N-acetyltransferase family protein [Sphingomonas sp. RS6]